jgi:CheY-like chemotaxis protein
MPHRILLIEDEPSNVKLFTRVLERRGGFEVHHTEDPEEALRLAAERGIALVLMDVSLSGSVYQGRAVDGLEITRLLKADPRSADIPVVLATAHTMKGDREALLAASGADDYVGKPITDFEAFIDVVARCIDKHSICR